MANYTSKHTGLEIDRVIEEAILYSLQSLTEEQKAQARLNIGAANIGETARIQLITWEAND